MRRYSFESRSLVEGLRSTVPEINRSIPEAALMQARTSPSREPRFAIVLELLTVAGFCALFFFYGLGSFGLVGADEPRYAQVAREMFLRHDWVTPVLNGVAWLEKPVLYYWGALASYAVFGVSDWAARVPSAIMATMLVFGAHIFLRRFRPGSQLDGALVMTSCAAIVGFSRAASTDMPLTAMFGLALLAWYGWLESNRKFWLGTAYVFLALATLAKGPVAPFLALLIVVVFCGFTRDFKTLGRMFWLPGLCLYFAVMLPWYVLVQIRNPQFFRVFLLEHNLARFGTNMFQHKQPFWYFVPVLLISVLPWLVLVILAVSRSLGTLIRRKLGPDARFELFLLLWGTLPVIFFSFSESKLPGYILPSIPAYSLLLGDYFAHKRAEAGRIAKPFVIVHCLLSGTVLAGALLVWFWISRVKPIPGAIIAAAIVGGAVALVMMVVIFLRGVTVVRAMTLVPVVLAIAFLIKMGAPVMDSHLSARPVAKEIKALEPSPAPVAVYQVKREVEYGLNFYLNRPIVDYDESPLPQQAYVFVVPEGKQEEALHLVPNWNASLLAKDEYQKLYLYWMTPVTPPVTSPLWPLPN